MPGSPAAFQTISVYEQNKENKNLPNLGMRKLRPQSAVAAGARAPAELPMRAQSALGAGPIRGQVGVGMTSKHSWKPPSMFSSRQSQQGRNHKNKSSLSVFSCGDQSVDLNKSKKYKRRPMVNKVSMPESIDISTLLVSIH